MKDKLNNDFIQAIQEILPTGVSIANQLVDILEIGKEASYRRLRNEVPFTFHEVVVIAQKLGISLDRIIGNYESKTAVFNLHLIHEDKVLTNYCDALYRYKEYLSLMKNDPDASISNIANSIPYVIYLPYKYIMKFRFSRWLHQKEKPGSGKSLDSIIIPENISKVQGEVQEALQDISRSYMIWDSHLFYSFIKEIDYFHKLNFISGKDLEHLKEELHTLLDNTERIASEGCYSTGNKVNIYLSNIHFESSYTYLEKGNFRITLIRLYSINSLETLHPEICRMQKEWIQTLKRYSTLITESGQIQRIRFFNDQRKLVDEL